MSNKQNNQLENHEGSIIQLRDIVDLIKLKRKFVASVTLTCFVLAMVFAFIRPPVYQSTGLIRVKGGQSGVSNLMAAFGLNAMGTGGGFFGKATPGDEETALIKTRYILGYVIDKLNLSVVAAPLRFPILGRLFSKLYMGQSYAAPFLGFSRYNWGGEKIKVGLLEVPENLQGLSFKVQSLGHQKYLVFAPNGQFILKGSVGKMVHSTNQAFPIVLKIDELTGAPGGQFVVSKKPPESMVGSLLSRLFIEEQGKGTGILQLSFRGNNPAFTQKILNTILAVAISKDVKDKSAEAAKTLNVLKKQLPNLDKQLDDSEKSINQFREKTGIVDKNLEEQMLLQNLSDMSHNLEQLKLKKLQLLQNFTPRHPYVLAVNTQEKQIEEQMAKVKSHLKQVPGRNQPLMNMEQKLKLRGDLYANTEKTMEQMEMLKNSTVGDVQLLSPATYPISPLANKTALISLSGLVLGFFLSVAILLVRRMVLPVVESPEVIEQMLQLPVVSLFPYSIKQEKLSKIMGRSSGLKSQQGYLLACTSPKDNVIESLRAFRTWLNLELLGNANNVVCITGVSPNIGKSFISGNLAALFGDFDKKTLLIDADMRKGYLHQYICAERSPGLSEYLQGTHSFDAVVVNSAIGGFDFLPRGAMARDPTRLLHGEHFEALLREAMRRYDLIIVDTPPVLAATDATLILKHTGINLMVIGAGMNDLDQVRQAKKILDVSGVQLKGTLMNHVNRASQESGAMKYAYYYDYYHDEKQ